MNLNAEIRDGHLITVDTKKVWAVELDLLEKFLSYCKKHNLKCWVHAGTLLGAVRHNGFIPWDDDIDLMMLREDYDRMCRIGNEGLEAPYFLQTPYSDVDYFRGHAQFRRSDTTGIRPSDSYEKFNQGIFIDIFPLDAVPDDRQLVHERCRYFRRTMRLLKAKNCSVLATGKFSLLLRKIRAKYRVYRYGWANIYSKAESGIRDLGKLPHTKVAELTFSADKVVWDKSLFDETVYLPFEHLMVPVPKEYDSFLTTKYGPDYMTPVKAPTVHGFVLFDTERGYLEHLPRVKKEFKRTLVKRLRKRIFK